MSEEGEVRDSSEGGWKERLSPGPHDPKLVLGGLTGMEGPGCSRARPYPARKKKEIKFSFEASYEVAGGPVVWTGNLEWDGTY